MAILVLILLFACYGAVVSPYLGFVCEQDEAIAPLIQLFRFLTLLSWPIVIIVAMAISWRYYQQKAYKKALYAHLYALVNIPLYLLLNLLSNLLLGDCDGSYIH